MSNTIGNSLGLSSPLKFEEEAKVVQKQGIVVCEQRRSASQTRSLSEKWLGLISSMKKVASSKELVITVGDSSSSSKEEEEEDGNEKKKEGDGHVDVWGSILLQKANEDSSKLPPPYVHPLVKKTASSLSDKSLQICTESLGSETGFSSDAEDEKEAQPQHEKESPSFVKYNYHMTTEKLNSKSFPPPLTSLDRLSLHMQPHRQNGRLVLEAVTMPSQNCFRAQRQDGRLLLTLANNPQEDPTEPEEMIDHQEERRVENSEGDKDEASEAEEQEEDWEEEEEVVEKFENEVRPKQIAIVMEQESKLSITVLDFHMSGLMMRKLMGLDNRNPTWTNQFHKGVNLVGVEEEGATPLAQSLPPPPRMALLIPSPPATTFNAYEYFWRTKTTMETLINPITQKCSSKNLILLTSPKSHEEQEIVLLRGNRGDNLVPFIRGCKEAKRSLMIWEPYCIASS